MRKLTAIALLFQLSLAAYGHELNTALGSDIAVSSKDGRSLVEYCPDNTCEVFSLRGKEAKSHIQDFAFVYLFSVSDYAYLKDFQSNQDSPLVQAVLNRYRQECPQQPTKQVALCIVSLLAKRHPIKASFVRYDEGKKNSSSISLGGYRRGT